MIITHNDNRQVVHCHVNEAVVLRLPGNPSTGYAWNIPGNATQAQGQTDNNRLTITRRFHPDPNAARASSASASTSASWHTSGLGAVGVFEFHITPLIAGKHTVKLVYSQPWNTELGLVDPADRFVLVLHVHA